LDFLNNYIFFNNILFYNSRKRGVINMIQCDGSCVNNIILHKVGNKGIDEGIKFSKSTLKVDELLTNILAKYFISPFKSEIYFRLFHQVDLRLNEVYTYISSIFDDPALLHEQSVNLAKHLYDQSTHPKIKGGEFYVVYFKDCTVDGKTVDAIGLFKSENKDTFLKIYPSQDGFEIESEKGININRLDKGCIIFNLEKENGYLVTIADNTNKGKGAEAKYWTEDFLNVKPRQDGYYYTENILSLYNNYISNELPRKFEISKAEQALLYSKSINTLKDNTNINLDEMSKKVFIKPQIIDSFNKYKTSYQEDKEVQFNDNIEVSQQALKRRAKGTMNIVKLDKNFDICIHGGEEYIQKGYDEEVKMNFYKLFFKEEK